MSTTRGMLRSSEYVMPWYVHFCTVPASTSLFGVQLMQPSEPWSTKKPRSLMYTQPSSVKKILSHVYTLRSGTKSNSG